MIKHFSHRHPLVASEIEDADDGGAICSGCELHLSGASYNCTKPDCQFQLHETCFQLPEQIRHDSHPDHPLTLLPSPPYEDHEFACDGCGDFGSGFIYHCARCQFDLHVQCATSPETVKSKHHGHPLVLFYSFPSKVTGKSFSCNVCSETIHFGRSWVYYCCHCDYGTHLNCATTLDEDDEFDEVIV